MMKAKLVLLLLAAAAIVSAADPTPFTGKWDVYINVADHEANLTCAFTQTGNDLSGDCSGDTGSGKVTGKIEGAKVTWSHGGGTVTLTFRGTLGKGADMTPQILGNVTVEEYGVVGEFSAAPSK